MRRDAFGDSLAEGNNCRRPESSNDQSMLFFEDRALPREKLTAP
jgi:hypothetical protein